MCSIEQHQILKARIPILLTPITINRASAFRIVRSRYVIGGGNCDCSRIFKMQYQRFACWQVPGACETGL